MNQHHNPFTLHRNFPLIAWTCIFLTALALRLLHLQAIYNTSAFSPTLGTSLDFESAAIKMANGTLKQEELSIILAAPYLAFLTWTYQLFGHSFLAARIIQCALGAATCLWIGMTAGLLHSKKLGYFAGLIAAVTGPFIFYDVEIAKPCLVNFCLSLSIFLLMKTSRSPKLISVTFLSILLATAVLLRPHLIFMFALIPVWIYWGNSPISRPLKMVYILVFFGAIAFTYSGWNFWFSLNAPKHVPTRAETGINFYFGNNPLAYGTYTPVKGIRESKLGHVVDAKRMAESETGRTLSMNEHNIFWIRKAWQFISGQPLQWLKLELKKLFLILHNHEISVGESYNYARHYSWALKLPLLTFGVIAPFGMMGIYFYLRQRDVQTLDLWLILTFFIIYTGSLLLTYTYSAYRLPLYLPMILFAVSGTANLPVLFKSRKALNENRYGLLVLLFFLVLANSQTFIPPSPIEQRLLAPKPKNPGEYYEKRIQEIEKRLRTEKQELIRTNLEKEIERLKIQQARFKKPAA